MTSHAQAHTLLDTQAQGLPIPPGNDVVPQIVPDAHGSIPIGSVFPGKGALPTYHVYISFPTDQLFVAVGIGLSFAMGLFIAPGCALNPTFTIAVAVFVP